MKLVFVSPGKFTMGSPESEPGREAQEVQHEVELTKSFYLGTCEVTVGQFKAFVSDAKYETDGERDGKGAYGITATGKIEQAQAQFTWKNPGFDQTDEHPVVSVSWTDAKAFCQWLSKKEKKAYRLPTEAEWEYACRAGTKTAFAHGDDPEGLAGTGNGADATARAKFPGWRIGIKAKDGYTFTAPVGQFKPNAFDLYDLHGNVWEWCEDWYEPNSYPKDKRTDPTGPATGKAKVHRGGGWSSDAKRLRSAARVGRDASAYRGCYLGFRVALVEAPIPKPKECREKKVLDWKPRTDPPDGLRALEKLTDPINEKHGRRAMVISPVAEATCKLIETVTAGKFPGITDPIELWVDGEMLKPGSHLRTLFAYCNVATMYGVSPVGLNPDFSALKWGGGKSAPTDPKSFADLAPITAEQRTILQQIVWETVSKYPHAGIAREP